MTAITAADHEIAISILSLTQQKICLDHHNCLVVQCNYVDAILPTTKLNINGPIGTNTLDVGTTIASHQYLQMTCAFNTRNGDHSKPKPLLLIVCRG